MDFLAWLAAVTMFSMGGLFNMMSATTAPSSSSSYASSSSTTSIVATSSALRTDGQTPTSITDKVISTRIKAGSGNTAVPGSRVSIIYKAAVKTSSTSAIVFDSTEAHGGKPLQFVLGGTQTGTYGEYRDIDTGTATIGFPASLDYVFGGVVVEGLQIGINGMKEGERRLLIIPPIFGYRGLSMLDTDAITKDAKTVVPKNATLVYEVELVGVASTTIPDADASLLSQNHPPVAYPFLDVKQDKNKVTVDVSRGPWTFYTFKVDFGDGTLQTVCATGAACAATTTITHTYMKTGSYTVRLVSVRDKGVSIPTSTTGMQKQIDVGVLSSEGVTPRLALVSPKGGETFPLGTSTKIVWEPTSYDGMNKLKDMSLSAETVSGEKVAQLHVDPELKYTSFLVEGTDTFIKPGTYILRLTNNVTGVSSKTAKPVTITNGKLDLKINYWDTAELHDRQPLAATFFMGGIYTKCVLEDVRATPDGLPRNFDVPTKAPYVTVNYYAYAPAAAASSQIVGTCTRTDGSTDSDSVRITHFKDASSLKLISPGGGEVIRLNQKFRIQWEHIGISKVSIALYKNDTFVDWLTKDYVPELDDFSSKYRSFYWVPGLATPDDYGKDIFSVKVVGTKSDGSGTLESTSDHFALENVPTN